MLYNIAAIIAGFLLVIWSADRFITGAAATARNLNVSPLIIGLTIVGFGTSAPEMLIAVIAAADASPGLAVGNAIGSNIANIGLVLGITATVSPLDAEAMASEMVVKLRMSEKKTVACLTCPPRPVRAFLLERHLGHVSPTPEQIRKLATFLLFILLTCITARHAPDLDAAGRWRFLWSFA